MKASQNGFNPDYAEEAPTAEQLAGLKGVALIEFGAPWCGHCQAAAPAVKQALAAHPLLPHIKVYDGKGKPLGRGFKVKLWPTLILLRDGVEVARLVRPLHAEQLTELLIQN